MSDWWAFLSIPGLGILFYAMTMIGLRRSPPPPQQSKRTESEFAAREAIKDARQLVLKEQWEQTGRAAAEEKLGGEFAAREAIKDARQLVLREEWERTGCAAAEEKLRASVIIPRAIEGTIDSVSPATPAVPMSSIYLIRGFHNGSIKVGKADNVQSRLNQLNTSSPTRLWLVESWPVPLTNVFRLERDIHKNLRKYRVNGEWFSCDEQIAKEAIKEAMDSLQCWSPRA